MTFKNQALGAAIALPMLFSTSALADDNQLWTAFSIAGPVQEEGRLLLWFDAHARFQDDASELGVSILRPGIGWRMNEKLDVWAGYARVTVAQTAGDIEEDRLWQQATYKLPQMLGVSISGRTRLEQRFRDAGDDTGWRIRQNIRWSKKSETSDLSYIIWNETFIGLNDADWGQRSGYDQNRLFLGVGLPVSSKVRFEGGYLNNHINRSTGGDLSNHNLSLSISTSF